MCFKSVKKYIFLSLFIVLLLGFTFLSAISKNLDNSVDLFPVWKSDKQLYFIDENGKPVVVFKPEEFDYVGNFSEGRVFLVKKIKILEEIGIYQYILAKLYIMDDKGKIIKKIPYDCIIGINQDLGEDDIPEFYKNNAFIHLKNNRILVVNNSGKIISKNKKSNNHIINNVQNINEDYINAHKENIDNMGKFYPSYKYKIDKNGPFPYYVAKGIDNCDCSLGCINYMDKSGKTVIKLNTCYPGGSGDFTIDPYFYNGVAMVFEDIPNPKRKFINNKGEYINNETYYIATPFWKKLASVVDLNENHYYINSIGKKIE